MPRPPVRRRSRPARRRCPRRWRQALRDEHAQAGGAQPGGGALEQPAVLEHAAGEDDRADPGAPAPRRARRGGGVGEPVVEARGDHAGGHAARDVAGDGEDERPRVEHAAVARELVRAALGRVAGRLELDRRLALVGDLDAQAAQRGHRVEQAAGARGDRRGEAGARHLGHGAPRARVDPAGQRGGQRRRRADAPRPATRTPSATAGAPRGRRPAGAPATGGPTRSAAAQVRRRAARRPTPSRPSRARRRRRWRRPPGPSRRARPGRRRGGRGGAGRRRVSTPVAAERVPRREVVRVQVVGDDLGLDREQPLEQLDALARRRRASRRS